MPFRKSRGLQIAPAVPVLDRDAPINRGLVGFWPLNETGGLQVFDASGHHNQGTLNGYTTRTNSPGRFGNALAFNGTNQYVNLPNGLGAKFSAGQFTVSAWVKAFAYSSAGSIFKNWGNTMGGFIHFGLYPDNNKMGFHIRDASNIEIGPVEDPNLMSLNVWHFYTAIADGGFLRLYLSGQQIASLTYDGTLLTNFLYTDIGAKPSDSGGYPIYSPGWWNGAIAGLRLFNRALQPTEIRLLYAQPMAGVLAPQRRIISGPSTTFLSLYGLARGAGMLRGAAVAAASVAGIGSGAARARGPTGAAAGVSGFAGGMARGRVAGGAAAGIAGLAAGGAGARGPAVASASVAGRASASARARAAASAAAAVAGRASGTGQSRALALASVLIAARGAGSGSATAPQSAASHIIGLAFGRGSMAGAASTNAFITAISARAVGIGSMRGVLSSTIPAWLWPLVLSAARTITPPAQIRLIEPPTRARAIEPPAAPRIIES